jgi:pimeloyl-ACP methyl ester carboxylesterase
MLKEQTFPYTEHTVQRGAFHLYAREYPGEGPTMVLMHGFPDNVHLYDRLVPLLSPSRRVVTFDFLGWGNSDKPASYPYTAANQVGDLDAVIEQLKLDQVVLVAHDASGPPAIDWALGHPDRVAALVLLNTYYLCHAHVTTTGSHLAQFHPSGEKRCARRLESLSQLALPQVVLVAGRQIHARGSRP